METCHRKTCFIVFLLNIIGVEGQLILVLKISMIIFSQARLNALKQILALLHSGESSVSGVLADSFGSTLTLKNLMLSAQIQLLLGTLGPEVVQLSTQPNEREGFLLCHYRVCFLSFKCELVWLRIYIALCTCLLRELRLSLSSQDDIKATNRKLQDEIQEAVHCLYQSLVAILRKTKDAECTKGSSHLYVKYYLFVL